MAEIATETARYCSQNGLTEEMVDAFRTALDNFDPSDTARRQRAMLSLIDGLMTLNRQADARTEMDAYLKAFPSEPRGQIMQAELLSRQREYARAAEALDGVISNMSDGNAVLRTYALYKRGIVHFESGDLALAKRDLEAAKRAGPTLFDFRHRLSLATVYEALGDYSVAAVELQQIIDAAPDSREAADRLMQLHRRRGQFEEAQRVTRDFMRKQPRSGYWPYVLGNLLIERGEFSAAVEPLRTALQLSSGAPPRAAAPVAEVLLRSLIGAGRYAEAIQGFESLPVELVTPAVRARGAEAYYRNGRKTDGLAQFEQAVQSSVDGSDWMDLVGVVGVAQSSVAETDLLGLFSRLAQTTDPAAAIPCQTAYAQVLLRLDRKQELAALVDPLVEKTPADSPWRLAVLQLQAELHRAEPEKLVAIYRQMIEADEATVLAMNNLAYILSDELNRPKEALEYAERAAALAPADVDIKDTLGWVRFLNGDLGGAEQVLRDGLRLAPSHVAARYHLGKVYVAQDLKTKAAAEFQRALDEARKSGDRRYEARIEEALKEIR
jgi:tetratricopeptide (TPR) repeat protein